MTPYHALPGLDGFYLEDSYVLAIEEGPTALRFSMELVLTPAHPDYTPALPGEQHCYRLGRLCFVGLQDVVWISRDWKHPDFRPAIDANGEVDYGNIDWFVETDGRFNLGGEWGEVWIKSDAVEISTSPNEL